MSEGIKSVDGASGRPAGRMKLAADGVLRRVASDLAVRIRCPLRYPEPSPEPGGALRSARPMASSIVSAVVVIS